MRKPFKKWQKVVAMIVLVAFLFQAGPVYATEQIFLESSIPIDEPLEEEIIVDEEVVEQDDPLVQGSSNGSEGVLSIFDSNPENLVPEDMDSLDGMIADEDAVYSDGVMPSDDFVVDRVIDGELEALREPSVKYFLNEDKTITASTYAYPVHYLDEETNAYEDIDNSLMDVVDSDLQAALENVSNAFSIKFAKKAKENKLVKMEFGGYKISWGLEGVNKDSEVVKTESEYVADDPTALTNITSSANYPGILNDVDLRYDLIGTEIKENIILNSANTPASFSFVYSTKELTMAQTEEGIFLYDPSGNVVSQFKPLFMIDANNEVSTDVSVELITLKDNQNNHEYRLTITPSQEWLNAVERVYPVNIDPSITIGGTNTSSGYTLESVYVNQGSPSSNYYNDVLSKNYFWLGTNNPDRYVALIKSSLPSAIKESDRVVSAYLSLTPYGTTFDAMANKNQPVIEAHEITSNWTPSSVTWNSLPSYDSFLTDYAIVRTEDGVTPNNRIYHWDVTKLVDKWFTTGNNYGILLKTPDDYMESYAYGSFWNAYNTVSTATRPTLSVTYLNMIGLEDYWTYHSQDAGLAGSGYINDYTGNLTTVFNDVTLDSARQPLSISHVFSSYTSSLEQPTLNVGKGFRLSIQESIKPVTINGTTKYIYTDGDGTEHYFEKNSSNKWVDDSGLNYTLNIANDYYTITDKKDNIKKFNRSIVYDTAAYLEYIIDNQGNEIQLHYENNKLSGVYDAADRYVDFETSNNRLSKMTLPDGKTVTYGYNSSGQLTSVTYKGSSEVNTGATGSNLTASFSYDSSGCINRLKDNVTNVSVAYDLEQANKIRRVKGYYILNGSSQYGKYYGIEYNYYNTAFYEKASSSTSNDNASRSEIYSFNTMGQTVSAVDQDGNAIFTKSGMSGGAKNKVTFASKTQHYVINYLHNHGVESDGYWDLNDALTGTTTSKNFVRKTASASEPAFEGQGMLKAYMHSSTDVHDIYGHYGGITVPGGSKYTFSTYIKTDYSSAAVGKGAYLKIEGGGKTVEKAGILSYGNYSRHQVTIDLTGVSGTVTLKVYVGVRDGYGSTYFDCMQLEKGGSASHYNLIENGDFYRGHLGGWAPVNLNSTTDTVQTGTAYGNGSGNYVNTDYAMQFRGDPKTKKQIYATINTSVKKGEGIVYGAWIKSGALPNKDDQDDGTKQSIGITVELSNGSTKQYSNLLITPTDKKWLYIAGNMIADNDYTSIRIYLKCNYNANFTYFDDVMLFKDSFGESFAYDSNGNIVTVVDKAQTTQSITTNSTSDITKYTDGMGNPYTMTYDSNTKRHRLTSVTAPDNSTTKMGYDAFGNLQNVSVYKQGDTTRAIRTTSIYDNKGLYLDETRDQRNISTYYDYNENSGVLNSVTDPGSTTAKTQYTYDADTDKLKTVSHTNANNNVSYQYSNNRMSQINVGGKTYNYAYNPVGNLLSVKAGSSSSNLESYTYDSGTGQMTQVNYGGVQSVNYVYDKQDRVTSISQGSNKIADFDYNANALLGRSTYYTEGNAVSNEYNYDFAERYVSSYNTKGFGTDTITYDKNNNNTGYRAFLKRNALDIAYLTSYTYTNVNNMDKMTVPASTVLDNTYDGFGRLSSTSTTTSGGSRALTTSLTYVDNGSQYASHLLDTYNVHFSGASSADYTYNYDYDNSGNVTTATINLSGTTTDTVYDYTYDSLNQLKRETKTGSTSNYDTTYNYDNRGNLTSKQTTGSSSSSATYTYGTQNGLEVLTKYTKTGTGAVTREYSYDNAGNPSTIDEIKSGTEKNYSLSWTQGKKLQRYSGGSIDNRYCYNESGLVSKLTKVNNTTVEYYYDDGLLEYEEYRNSSGTLQRVHKYFYDSDGTVRFLLTKTGNFDNSNNFNLYAYIYDGTGNITDLVRLQREGSSTPTAVVEHAAHYEYDAFGKILSSTNKGSGESIASLNPIKYKGYYYDSEIAMYRLETRFYDPEIGRFLNADDLSLLQETPYDFTDKNLYSYCDNNPVIRMDSDGEYWVAVAGAGIAVSPMVIVGLVASAIIITAVVVYAKSKPKTGRPELKKQGREKLEKKKGKPEWKKKSGKKERSQPRPHHPSKKGHRKYSQNKGKK